MYRWQADIALVVVTAIWGSTFVVVKGALDTVGPFTFVAARFWVAVTALSVTALSRRIAGARRDADSPGQAASPHDLLRGGAVTGLFLTLGYTAQTLGLQTTAAAKAAFITGLSVVMVPVLAALLLRHPPTRASALGVVLATAGLALLTLEPGLALAPGDLWVLLCALGFASHITATARFAPRHDALAFTLAQMLVAALLASAAALLFERGALRLPRGALPAVIYMGLFASALVFFVQSWAQQRTTPTRTALIFALEPVFAALFAVLFAGEVLAAREWGGGALILLGMVVAELGPREDGG